MLNKSSAKIKKILFIFIYLIQSANIIKRNNRLGNDFNNTSKTNQYANQAKGEGHKAKELANW